MGATNRPSVSSGATCGSDDTICAGVAAGSNARRDLHDSDSIATVAQAVERTGGLLPPPSPRPRVSAAKNQHSGPERREALSIETEHLLQIRPGRAVLGVDDVEAFLLIRLADFEECP